MIAASVPNQKKIGMPVADQQKYGTNTPTMLEMKIDAGEENSDATSNR